MSDLTPRQIVAELDRDIVGQGEAKRAVAVALRNRWRRKQLSDDLQAQVVPKNILLIGPTGVGKTEIARRLASLVGAPFVKVEATKYTEVRVLRPRRREPGPRPRRSVDQPGPGGRAGESRHHRRRAGELEVARPPPPRAGGRLVEPVRRPPTRATAGSGRARS